MSVFLVSFFLSFSLSARAEIIDGEQRGFQSEKSLQTDNNQKKAVETSAPSPSCTNRLLNHSYGLAIDNTQVMLRDSKKAKEILRKLIDKGILGSVWLPRSLTKVTAMEPYLSSNDSTFNYSFLSSIEGSNIRSESSSAIVSHINSLFYLSQPLADKLVLEAGAKALDLSFKDYVQQRNFLLQVYKNQDFREFFRALIEDCLPNLYLSYFAIKKLDQQLSHFTNSRGNYRSHLLRGFAQKLRSVWGAVLVGGATFSLPFAYTLSSSYSSEVIGPWAFVAIVATVINGLVEGNTYSGLQRIYSTLLDYLATLQDSTMNKLIIASYNKTKASAISLKIGRFARESRLNYLSQLGAHTDKQNKYLDAINKDDVLEGNYISYSPEEKIQDVSIFSEKLNVLLGELTSSINESLKTTVLTNSSELSSVFNSAFINLAELRGYVDNDDVSEQIFALTQLTSPKDSPFIVLTKRIKDRLLENRKFLTTILGFATTLEQQHGQFLETLSAVESSENIHFKNSLESFIKNLTSQHQQSFSPSLRAFIAATEQELNLNFSVEESINSMERNQALQYNKDTFQQNLLDIQEALVPGPKR